MSSLLCVRGALLIYQSDNLLLGHRRVLEVKIVADFRQSAGVHVE